MPIAYPPPTGDQLTQAQREAMQRIETALAAAEYDRQRVQPLLPGLAEAMATACPTEDDRGRMIAELDRMVRWWRLPGHYFSFLFQLALQQSHSPMYIVACCLYADAQISANSDLLLNSLENAHKVLAQWLAQNGPGEGNAAGLNAVAGEVRRRLHLVYSYYRHWYTGQSYRNINPLTEHLYSEKTRADLTTAFPQLAGPLAYLKAEDYLGVIAQCDTSGDAYCRVVAQRFLGSLYHAGGDLDAALQQFDLALEEAIRIGLDAEIGHLHRLFGYALSAGGHQDLAAQQFLLAYKHESPVEYGYWRALSARELGDARLKSCPGSIDLDHPPPILRDAVNAYKGGRLEFEAILGMGTVPVARAVGQQLFRSYSDDALQAAMALRSMPEMLAEWEASGPRYVTDVVAESRAAATTLPSDAQAPFRRARALFHAHLGVFNAARDQEKDFDAYLASVERDAEARHLYVSGRIALTTPITHAQFSDEIIAQILALRLPNVVFALMHVGDGSVSVTILDVGSGQMATAETAIGEADWQPVHEAYRQALRDSHGLPDPAPALRPALDALLGAYQQSLGQALEPFLPFLHGRHLKFFPRLFMNEVPLHALTVGGALLADHCPSVSYAQTLGLFLQIHRPDPVISPRTLAMLHDTHGAPHYAGTVQALTPLLGDTLTLMPDPAWPAALDALSAKCPTDLFFACHGEYDADDPAASRLLLGGEGGVSFERLFADLDLSACDCVTLGACESGLGRTLVTAEYLGLPTAFFAAGVRYVIGSLWKVNQLTAAILLGHYYRLLHDGAHTVPAALAEAQRLVRRMSRDDVRAWLQANLPQKAAAWEVLIRRMGDAPFAHPYYWAGFYVAGDV